MTVVCNQKTLPLGVCLQLILTVMQCMYSVQSAVFEVTDIA